MDLFGKSQASIFCHIKSKIVLVRVCLEICPTMSKENIRETRTEEDCMFIFVFGFYPNLELV